MTGEPMSSPGPVGGRIDRYEVLSLLGMGGFGAVYRARHVHTEQQVALKVLKRQLNADASMLERLLREAKAATAIGSDHIVRVLDAGISNEGQAFVAMELLDGWDLKELAARAGPLPPVRVVMIMLQVLDALGAAHEKGIVHRDMKPANVFLVRVVGDDGVERDFVKLLDFGISKMHQEGPINQQTLPGMAMGTPAYMAPEQFFSARDVDGRADLYSVAVMLYELLGGRLPFDAQSYAELVVKVRTEQPKPLGTLAPKLPPALLSAIERGLARDAAARWQTASDFADALRAAMNIPARRRSSSHATRPPAAVRIDPTPRVTPSSSVSDASLLHGSTVTPSRPPVAAAQVGAATPGQELRLTPNPAAVGPEAWSRLPPPPEPEDEPVPAALAAGSARPVARAAGGAAVPIGTAGPVRTVATAPQALPQMGAPQMGTPVTPPVAQPWPPSAGAVHATPVAPPPGWNQASTPPWNVARL